MSHIISIFEKCDKSEFTDSRQKMLARIQPGLSLAAPPPGLVHAPPFST